MFRQLVESVRDYGIFALTPEGTIATWNSGAERIKGYTADEAIGRHFSMFYPAGAVARGWPAEELRRATLDGRFEDEGFRVRKDGSTFWANVVISPILDDHGELIGFSKVTRDLTERRESERLLEESERNQRLLVESVRDHAMFLLDAGGLVRTWNAGCDRVFELSANDVVGKHVGNLYTDSDVARGVPRNELASAAAARVHHADGQRRKGASGAFPAEVTTASLTNREGALTGFVLVVRDLTHHDRVVSLEAESKRVHEFIAMLSHELRNPLAPIRNAVTLLQRVSSEPTLKRSTDIIDRQLTNLTRIVDDLLDVSRITGGSIHIARQQVNIVEVVNASISSTRQLAQSRHHRVSASFTDEPLIVLGDGARLTQVFVSLLTNASKYTLDGGEVVVSARDGDGLATVKVTDNGIGMGDELLRRAFDPLVQGERALARTDGGLGIGLTLVKSIVELHGGTVAAASAGTGHGTTVTVTLPIVQSNGENVSTTGAPGSASVRVLVVDDNVDAAQVVANILELDGHEVSIAHDGPAALEKVRGGFPDLVILDIGLPMMTGHDVARQMRQMPGGADVRIVALSGYGQESDLQQSATAGIDNHFVKPVDAEVLSLYVASIAHQRNAGQT
ncbi:hypothetical protein ASC76_18020 [Rhizobacter sp. Root404]|nr:hypothetical protein ASC76_18020 [Rhizobacter sp. Root404]